MAQGAEADVSGGRISGKLEIPIEHDVDGDRFVDDALLLWDRQLLGKAPQVSSNLLREDGVPGRTGGWPPRGATLCSRPLGFEMRMGRAKT